MSSVPAPASATTLLIKHARPLYRPVQKIHFGTWPEFVTTGTESLHELEKALSRLAGIDPQFRTVEEMRVFAGLTAEETANRSGCPPRTAQRTGVCQTAGRRSWRIRYMHDRPAVAASLGIYRAARELPEAQRSSYLSSISADPEVFERVMLLIDEPAGPLQRYRI